MKHLLIVTIAMLSVYTNAFGFATIYHSVKGGDEIKFNTNVDQVSIYNEYNNKIGATNNKFFAYTIITREGKPKTFTFKKKGYKPATVTVGTAFEPVFFGNFLFGGSIGSSIDSITTKNATKYSPNQYFIELEKVRN